MPGQVDKVVICAHAAARAATAFAECLSNDGDMSDEDAKLAIEVYGKQIKDSGNLGLKIERRRQPRDC